MDRVADGDVLSDTTLDRHFPPTQPPNEYPSVSNVDKMDQQTKVSTSSPGGTIDVYGVSGEEWTTTPGVRVVRGRVGVTVGRPGATRTYG